MRKWQGIILIILTMLASTAAGYASKTAEHADKIAPPAMESNGPVERGNL